jgi:hypothetical protein
MKLALFSSTLVVLALILVAKLQSKQTSRWSK